MIVVGSLMISTEQTEPNKDCIMHYETILSPTKGGVIGDLNYTIENIIKYCLKKKNRL